MRINKMFLKLSIFSGAIAFFFFSFLIGGIKIAEAVSTETFTSTTTWTAPAGVTSVQAEVWGGGGGGGGKALDSDGGGGGGGGAYSRENSATVAPGNVYTVTVGSAGTGSTGCTASTAGGDSWFISTATVLAKGGSPGACSTGTPPVGGAGGASGSGVGDAVFSGGQGEKGVNNNNGRGGYGGSSAGTGADCWSGPQTFSPVTYPTANPPTGGGHGGDGGTANTNGNAPASGNGGGGGGAGDDTDASDQTGGAGKVGKIILTYNKPPNAPTQNSPSNGATGVSVTPTFLMTATDADSTVDDISYKVTIYSDSACTTTSTFYPDPDPETTSVDGDTARSNTTSANESWTQVRGSSGNVVTHDANYAEVGIEADADTSDSWQAMFRAVFGFDTSCIPNTDTIDSATLGFVGIAKVDDFSQSLVIDRNPPATATTLAVGDYNIAGWTAAGGVEQSTARMPIAAISNVAGSTYNYFILNSTGLGNVSKTGVSWFGVRVSADFDNSAPTWVTNADSYLWIRTAEISTAKPKLTVVHSVPATQTNDQAVSSTGWTGTDATCTASPTSCYASGTQGSFLTQTALANSTQYWWKASAKDPDGNGSFTDSSTCNSFTPTAAAPPLTFTVSDNDIFFGSLSPSASQWADNTADGSTTAVVAHTLTAATSSTNGYTITVQGATIASTGTPADTITAMGTEAALDTGEVEQFGLRITASGGDGAVDTNYDDTPANSYFYGANATTSDEIATDANGDDVSTTYSLYYAANIATTTEAHSDYQAALTYVITGNF